MLHLRYHILEFFIFLFLEPIMSLLRFNADVNRSDNEGDTPFLIACRRDNLATFFAMLNANSDLSIVDHQGNGPLHSAIKAPRIRLEFVQALLLNGCCP